MLQTIGLPFGSFPTAGRERGAGPEERAPRGGIVRAYLSVIVLLFAIFGSIAAYLYAQSRAGENADFTPPPVTIAAGVARQEAQVAYLDAVGTVKAIRGHRPDLGIGR